VAKNYQKYSLRWRINRDGARKCCSMTAESEARFTPPRPDCPHPEWWTSTDDDSTECEVTALVAAFVVALQPELVIETGTAFGQTAEAIGHRWPRTVTAGW
jgi:hypothetical protein